MNKQTSSFLADRFIARGKYQELEAQLAEKRAQLDEAIMRLGEVSKRMRDAEQTLVALHYKRAEDGIWFNSDL